ncbi:MAG: hypothetical protein GY839_19425 [candidate division Zixibacteria bacterium]|nr:hypothetical protein [candidate division Zixibacteria bacterium]
MKWIKFLKKYGPIARNDNMYDETILRSSRQMKVDPILFEHPYEKDVLGCFSQSSANDLTSVILTGTAGDGKTHLCRQVWDFLGEDEEVWDSDDPYLKTVIKYPKDADSSLVDPQEISFHFIRDLSSWAPQMNQPWESAKKELLNKFCQSLFLKQTTDIFLIAGNDGQLIESFRRLDNEPLVNKARQAFEDLLVEGKQQLENVRLRFFNLSRGNSAELFRRAIKSFLNHSGWQECLDDTEGDNSIFGVNCPIRHNYELLGTELVQARLEALFDLCDHNGLHIPLRQILLLFANAVLGHPDVRDRLMVAKDIPKLLVDGTASKASLYNNIFGGNLTDARRQGIIIFDYFGRFQIGYETSNRIDNILLYGDTDPCLQTYYKDLIESDRFYGADDRYYAAKREYIEGVNESDISSKEFFELLISQRRGLFFKIPQEKEKELKLWELTVFKFAGEYISDVRNAVRNGIPVKRPILARLVKGLNRVFTGMLINNDREIILATSGNYSQARISRIIVDHISVHPSKGEQVTIDFDEDISQIRFTVQLSPEIKEGMDLNLIRFEFLSRIALDGALPASFSKECYEDILSFKSQLLAALNRREDVDDYVHRPNELRILSLSDKGIAEENYVEVIP